MPGPPPAMLVHQAEPYNAEPPRTALAGRDLTPVAAFYHRNHGPLPDLDTAGWALHVDGAVDRPGSYSTAVLRERFAEHEETVTLQCAGARRSGLTAVAALPGEIPWGPGATGTARWAGVRLADVLADAGADPAAGHVAFLGADVSDEPSPPQPFGASIPQEKALAPETLLAWSMNGEPLPAAHGAPLRVVVPGWIGARSVKWLTRITVQDRPSRNHFQEVAYRLLPPGAEAAPGAGVALGPIAVNADVLSPDDGAEVPRGRTPVTGYALAGGDRTVVRVDVSVDGGTTWTQADLDPQPSRWSWRHWHLELDLPAGSTEIVARAWDSATGTQPSDPLQLWNPKGYVNNAWARVTVHAR